MLKKICDFLRKNIGMFMMTLIALLSSVITIVCGWSDFYSNFLSKSISISVIGVILIIILVIIVLKISLSYLKSNSAKQIKYPEIFSFNASYRKTDWNQLFGLAEYSITICSFYLDTFTVWTNNDIEQFLKKDNTKLSVIVSDYNSEENLKFIARLFPQYSIDIVKSKITGTKSKIVEILDKIGVSTSKFDFYVYDNILNYSYILIDEKYLYLSIYEMERSVKMDSPAVIFDLEKNRELKDYIIKENFQILKKAHKE